MDSLKIAMLAPEFLPNWGGAGTYSILLARELSKTDEVHVFTTLRGADDREKARREMEHYFDDRVRVRIVSAAKERFWYNAIYQFNIAKGMPATMDKERYDIIHSNHAHMPDLGLKLWRPVGRSVTTVHTTLTTQFLGIKSSAGEITHMDGSERMVRFGFPFLTLAERYYLAKTKNMIFVSDFIRREVDRITKGRQVNSMLIRNGIDLEHFRPAAAGNAGGVNIMYTGRLLTLKGLNHLLEAFAGIHRAVPGTHLTLVGDGDVAKWSEIARQSGVPKDSLTFAGRKTYEEMPGMYARADVFVLPSMSESMPLSLLEAMACGRPCVASRVGGIPEIVEHGRTGLLVKPGDPGELEGALSELVRDAGLRARIGKAGAGRVAADFSLAGMVRATRQMFCGVAAGGST